MKRDHEGECGTINDYRYQIYVKYGMIGKATGVIIGAFNLIIAL